MGRQHGLAENLANGHARSAVSESFDADTTASTPADVTRCGILVRVSPTLRRELKVMSAQQGTNIQALMVEAIADLLVKHGRPPIV